MVQFGDYSVAIVVDGEPLPEFDVNISDDAKTASCWIPSEAGKVSFHYVVLFFSEVKPLAGISHAVQRFP